MSKTLEKQKPWNFLKKLARSKLARAIVFEKRSSLGYRFQVGHQDALFMLCCLCVYVMCCVLIWYTSIYCSMLFCIVLRCIFLFCSFLWFLYFLYCMLFYDVLFCVFLFFYLFMCYGLLCFSVLVYAMSWCVSLSFSSLCCTLLCHAVCLFCFASLCFSVSPRYLSSHNMLWCGLSIAHIQVMEFKKTRVTFQMPIRTPSQSVRLSASQPLPTKRQSAPASHPLPLCVVSSPTLKYLHTHTHTHGQHTHMVYTHGNVIIFT